VLFFAQAVLGAQIPINVILGGLAGRALASDPGLATLPLSVMVLVAMFAAPAASLLMGRVGRRAGFMCGAVAGGLGGLISARALFVGSFEGLLLGAACTGVYNAFQGFYRFAAADTASDTFKPKAISWVLAGGLLSALLGPEIVRQVAGAFAPTPFAGAYVAVIGLNLVGLCGLLLLDIPVPTRPADRSSGGRPLSEIFRQPRVIVAVLCAMTSYALMSLVMTATPLAMVSHGFNTDHAADVVRWHVVAMFAPSFFTGPLITRFGHARIIATGLLLVAACGGVALLGTELDKFYIALAVLGIGWNFGFIGATSLLATSYSPAERAKVQGLNDFLVFGFVAMASFTSGALLSSYGWQTVQIAMLPGLILAALALAWFSLRGRALGRAANAP